mmetsp:Transcript_22632/g.31554  ORF Transcript_22632/g.31554 Transcript_22632/m.31554 type:complete len:110 (+) Transcript_22632:330-659(+)
MTLKKQQTNSLTVLLRRFKARARRRKIRVTPKRLCQNQCPCMMVLLVHDATGVDLAAEMIMGVIVVDPHVVMAVVVGAELTVLKQEMKDFIRGHTLRPIRMNLFGIRNH